jgi:adenine-specific DNA-methyltransferase
MATGVSKANWNGSDIKRESQGKSNGYPELSYEGKKAEGEILSRPIAQFEKVWGDELANNRLYFADNFSVLSNLFHDEEIFGNVQLIYIDPPFSTNSVFQTRDLEDAYRDLYTGAEYLEFLRERLILMREILSENGSIYIHLDQKMVFPVKVLMDEIFGEKNFRNFVTRKKCNPKNYTRKNFGNVSDHILFYTKSDRYVWHRPFEAWTEERATEEYQYIEEKTGRRFKKVPIHAPGHRNGETGKPWRGKLPPPGKHWQYTPSKLDELDRNGEIFWSDNGNPRRKIYLDNSPGIPYQDIWMDFKDAHNQNIKITGYPTEKNQDLIKLIIEASSSKGDMVLDSFAGSGTTLEMAEELERNWIGIDNSLEAIRSTLRRFAIGTQPMGDYVENKKAGNKNDSKNLPLFREEIKKSLINKSKSTQDFSILVDVQNDQKKELAEIVGEFVEQINI